TRLPPRCRRGRRSAATSRAPGSTYRYNGELYETNIGEGLNIFAPKFKVKGARHLPWLNPQTQDFSIKSRFDRKSWRASPRAPFEGAAPAAPLALPRAGRCSVSRA
ncbi:MAG TPA: hypothetical protein VFR63_00720, partial [Gaiellaceae bacterium]|nr:hypothetical protein [Gaiellaceae bacterium]